MGENEAKSLTLCWAFYDLQRGDIFMKEVFEFFLELKKKCTFVSVIQRQNGLPENSI